MSKYDPNKFSTAQKQYRSVIAMLSMMDQCIEVKQFEARMYPEEDLPTPGSALQERNPNLPTPGSAFRNRKTVFKRIANKVRKIAAQRFRIRAKVLIHKNDRYVKGRALNISKSGLFVTADRKVFQTDEIVRLAIKPTGADRYFKSIARVVRFDGQNGRQGYGLQFIYPKVKKLVY